MFHLWFSTHWGHSRSSVRSADTALLIQSILGICKCIITHYDFTCSYFTPKVVHLWKQHSPTHYVNNLNELPGIYIWCSIFFQITASTPIWDHIVHLKRCKMLHVFYTMFFLSTNIHKYASENNFLKRKYFCSKCKCHIYNPLFNKQKL